METKKTVVVIINPIAGVRSKEEVPALVHKALPDDNFDVEIRYTEYAGHASVIAQEASQANIDYVLAIGGDGTINETARSLVGSKTALGIVPMGSGNGLARHIHIPLEIGRALQVVAEGHTEKIDYGIINNHIFFCTAGIGFDAQVSKKFSEMKQRGGFTYVRSILDLLSNYKPSTYVIYTDDGRIKEKAFLIAIGNASQYGNNAYITPRASMQDGQMDITLIKPFNLLDATQMAIQLFSRHIDDNENILSFRSSHIRIIMPQANVVHVDGEPILMDSVLDIQTMADGLYVLTPESPMHNLLEPLQYAIEEINYQIFNNIRNNFKDVFEGVKKVGENLQDKVLDPKVFTTLPEKVLTTIPDVVHTLAEKAKNVTEMHPFNDVASANKDDNDAVDDDETDVAENAKEPNTDELITKESNTDESNTDESKTDKRDALDAKSKAEYADSEGDKA